MGGSKDKVKETEEQKAQAKVAKEQWDRYQEKYVPVENQFMEDVQKMGEEGTYQDVAGDVGTSYRKAYTEQGAAQERQMASAGIDPSSGKAKSARRSLSDAQAKGMADATSQAQHDVTSAYTGNLSNIVAMGKGQETQATHGLADISERATRRAGQEAINKASEESIPAAVAGGVASAAVRNPDAVKDMFSPSGTSLGAANTNPDYRPA